MRRSRSSAAVAAIVLVPALALAVAPEGTPATITPYASSTLLGWVQTLTNVADAFRAGAQQKVEVSAAWLEGVRGVAKQACAIGKDLIAWHDAQPPAAWDAIYACLQTSRGAWTSACNLDLNLSTSMGCGGTNGPAYCYASWADDAASSAAALDAWKRCVDAGIPAQARADAAAAQARADAANGSGANAGTGANGTGSASSSSGAGASGNDAGANDAPRDEATRRDGNVRARDAQVSNVYDAKSAEIARRNALADRWARGVATQQELLQGQTEASIGMMNAIQGGGNAASGASWRVHAFVGAGGLVFPVFTDATGADISPFSGVSPAGGLAFDGSLELWPYFGPHAGIGAALEGALGWFPTVNGSAIAMEGYLAGRGFIGSDGRAALLFELGHAWRQGGHTGDIGGGVADAYENGTATYQVARFGGGVRYCIWSQAEDPRFCFGGIDAMVFVDALAGGKRPLVGRLSFWARGMVTLGVDLGLDYPAAGHPTYQADDDRGTFVLVRIDKGWDWFGKPYGTTTANKGGAK